MERCFFKLKLNEILNSEECNLHDCFVLYIDSHGKEHGFVTANNNVFEYHKIFELFCNANCQKLIGKPKIILFDCCRWENFSTLSGHFNNVDYNIPNVLAYGDIFVCFSTLKGQIIAYLGKD